MPNGIPSHDTFRRVFCLLDPATFLDCFQRWIDALSAGLGLKRIHHTVELVDTPEVRGMIERVSYLVRLES